MRRCLGIIFDTTEHLRPLLDDAHSTHMFFRMGGNLARAQVPEVAVAAVRSGRMTSLSKEDGGVRGIVTGDVVRRLVARIIAEQLGPAVKAATAPHQYALSTRAGCECIAHAIQALCGLNPGATVTSVDGIGAYDSISKRAMLQGLMQVGGGSATLPFVRMFYGAPSEYLWEDDFGQVHTISQGEGGEQSDALMPLLFARTLRASVFMFAFLDDIYFITAPNRVGAIYATLQEALWAHARIAIHLGKTKVWNASGIRPEICTVLERMARETYRTARVWKGSEVPEDEQGMKVLGTPLGHPQYVRRFLSQLSEKHKVLLRRIPRLDDVQSAWLLLAHCAAARANYSLRCVEPQDVELFARTHDFQMRQCLSSVLNQFGRGRPGNAGFRDIAIVNGGIGAQECSADEQGCTLGQLGRLLGHDQRTPPRSRSIDGGRVGRRPSNVLLGSSCFSGKRVDRSVRF